MWRLLRVNLITAQEGFAVIALRQRLFFCLVPSAHNQVRQKKEVTVSQASNNASPNMPTRQQKPAVILFVAAFAAFLATFNETFLNVGFAPIMEALDVDVSTVQWLATAYMLGAAVMVPVSAFAYRSFPTRPLFCATTALLVIGSVVGGLATNFTVLLIGRIIQALGTGMLIPIGMNITLEVAPRKKLGTYMGIMGAMTTLGPSSSVILAGFILAIAPWNVLLWVFAGLSLLCLISGAIILRDIAKLTHPRLDAASVALIGVALIGILYGISTIFAGNAVFAVIAAIIGVISLIFFIRRQGRLKEPLIDLRPLKITPFAVGVVLNMLALISIFAMNIIVPTYMQSILNTPPLIASLILFPAILLSCIASPIAGRIYDKQGPRILLPVGFACITVFSILTAVFISTVSPVLLAIIYIPVICGSALIIGPVQSFALSKLSPELNPHGVTVMSTGFQIAGCIGSSVFTGVYSLVSSSGAADGLPLDAATTQGMLISGVSIGVVTLVGLALSLWVSRLAKYPIADAAASQAEAHDGRTYASVDTLAAIMKADVYSVTPTTTVAEAMRLFSDKGISGAPVVDSDLYVIGFISDGDIMGALADQIPAFKTAWSFVVERDNEDFDKTLRQVMDKPVIDLANKHVISVDIDDDLGEVARVLAENHLKKAPVLENNHMVGIINRSNITNYALGRFGL